MMRVQLEPGADSATVQLDDDHIAFMYPCEAFGSWFEVGHHGDMGTLCAPMLSDGSLDTDDICDVAVTYTEATGEPEPMCEHKGWRSLSLQVEHIGQDVTYTQLWASKGGTRVRVRIRRNAYDSQSSATASLFDGSKWHVIADLPRDKMNVHAVVVLAQGGSRKVVTYVKRLDTEGVKAFERDEAELLRIAALTIGEVEL